MGLHPWLTVFGDELAAGSPIELPAARDLADIVARGLVPGVSLVSVRQADHRVAVHILVEVERPQDLAHPIKASEPIAVVFSRAGGRPAILALREDFPDTPHQNATPPNTPASLCIDDRPWHEARLTYTPMDLARQIQLWLAKAARGELHDRSLPPEPLFFPEPVSIVLPSAAIAPGGHHLPLVGYIRPDNKSLIITEVAEPASAKRAGALSVLQYQAHPQTLSRMRHAPQTLGALANELTSHGVDLLDNLKKQLRDWTSNDNAHRFSSLLVLVIAFPVLDERGQTATDLRAFLTVQTAGEIGDKLGVLLMHHPLVKGPKVYANAIAPGKANPEAISIEPVRVHLSFDRAIAERISGRAVSDPRRAVLVGAGSIGSHIASNLAREGHFRWSVIDNDALLPHNLARHALLPLDVGAPKALALAHHLTALLGDPCEGIVADVLAPGAERDRVNKAFTETDVLIDASASVAVSRHLSDLQTTKARRVCAFFNPAGTSVVVLTEPSDRSVTLHDLEAQYFRLLLTDRALAAHLQPPAPGVSYSGSCRALTNRIPASRASILSALASRGIIDSLGHEHGSISIWTLDDSSGVSHVSQRASAVHAYDGCCKVIYSDDLLSDLTQLRTAGLPAETGGILMGIVDTSRRTVHLAHALPAPEDSTASTTGFERGVVGLLDATNRIAQSTMHQLKYVGEWHSHPDRASVRPSGTDVEQIVWLASELSAEGLPAIMAIAGQDGRFAIMVGGVTSAASASGRPA